MIEPGREPEWLVAGLTVVPAQRRRGIAARLLREVVEKRHSAAPIAPVFSVINAQNLASLRLHDGIGFEEIGRAATYARIDFTGGEGVLLRKRAALDSRMISRYHLVGGGHDDERADPWTE